MKKRFEITPYIGSVDEAIKQHMALEVERLRAENEWLKSELAEYHALTPHFADGIETLPGDKRVDDLRNKLAQLVQWQALGRELVAAFEIERHAGDSDGISIVVDESDRFGGDMVYFNFDYKEDKVRRRVALIRLLELTSAMAQGE